MTSSNHSSTARGAFLHSWMTLLQFWREAPASSRVALGSAALSTLCFVLTWAGPLAVEIASGTLFFVVLAIVVIAHVSYWRTMRMGRVTWRASGNGFLPSVIDGVSGRLPARPRAFWWIILAAFTGVAVAVLVAALTESGPVLSSRSTEVRVFAAIGVIAGVLVARFADTLARRERLLESYTRAQSS